MRHVVTLTLVLVGIIHLLPLAGVLGPGQLESLYGISLHDPNVVILMRHRAVLFGILGAFLVIAGFVRSMQPSAFILGSSAVASFLLLAWMSTGYNPSIARVVTADLVAAALLVLGGGAFVLARQRP